MLLYPCTLIGWSAVAVKFKTVILLVAESTSAATRDVQMCVFWPLQRPLCRFLGASSSRFSLLRKDERLSRSVRLHKGRCMFQSRKTFNQARLKCDFIFREWIQKKVHLKNLGFVVVALPSATKSWSETFAAVNLTGRGRKNWGKWGKTLKYRRHWFIDCKVTWRLFVVLEQLQQLF